MKIFVDSSFLIALVNENDSLHEKSLEYIDLIEKNDCYISNLVINEVITVIGNKIDLETAISAFDLINDIFHIINEYEIKDFNSTTMLIYEKHGTKLSFTDCSIIVDMHYHKIENLLSFDKEFKKAEGINLIF
ncbi:MAG: type II toxin-antitoxin system VapC family toxin [Methanobrevibacter sp.]|uniref:type II toxin-antitoxin system VapC family toxin n=1 Tax=Methanobrevibacter sp. TaxID=66852 RepID=UPI0025E0AFE1|nr:type II toxin-antitoxin system VapC family toxin [Methanobrevibacter sp.]MBQ3473506.1 type II toxin-antitoxin system VapC family toxin [Methanobrevibacter sp.]MBQ6138328.1 type II toxin-antitoxin system VapC family toxin [Methanobrevibacter sp.]